MNNVNEIIQSIKNNEIDCELASAQMNIQDYYVVLKEIMNDSKEKHQDTQAHYCALYVIELVESSKNQAFVIDKQTYETALELVTKAKQGYKKYVYKNLFVSFCIFGLILFMLFKVLHFDLILSFLFAATVFLFDLYMNGKTNQTRYQQKLVRMFEKEVNPSLVALTKIIL